MSAAPTNTPSQPSAGPVRRCPICGKPAVPRYRPFCSKRCADIDLGRWLGEIYRIPAEENDAGEPPSDDSAESTGR